jgi:hypothetical protein
MNPPRSVPGLSLSGCLAVACLLSGPAGAASLDSQWNILRVVAEEPEVADELDYHRRSGYQEEPAEVLLLGAQCSGNGCHRQYLVLYPFTRKGEGSPLFSVMAQVLISPDERLVGVRHVGLRPLEIDREGHRRSDARERQEIERTINDALRSGLLDLEAIRDPTRQTELVACVSKARAAFAPALLPRNFYPRPTYLVVVRRSQDDEGRFPEASLYVIDGHSESTFLGYEWQGTILDSQDGTRSQFPVSEVMDLMRLSPDGIVDGPYTPPCLRRITTK